MGGALRPAPPVSSGHVQVPGTEQWLERGCL